MSFCYLVGGVAADILKATPDGRGLVAIGCAEGVWIGYRHDSKCKSDEMTTLGPSNIVL